MPKITSIKSFPCNFPKTFIGPSLLRHKFLDLKFLQGSRNLWELLISVIKAGGFIIRCFAKGARKL